uniref:CCHC-type domain-containing protein n=1 Tax=Sander lucioperca TaxID=283035 RepID=A0A8C9X8K7_SANLU
CFPLCRPGPALPLFSDTTPEFTQIRTAIANQGILLGQHDTLFKTISENSQMLLNQVQLLTNQVSALTTQVNAAPPVQGIQTAPSPTPPVFPALPAQIREPFVPAPERYDGNMGTCGDFLTQCSLVFEQQPLTYASERSRIAYLINSTSGSARSWGSAVWESQSDVCNSYVAFTTEMRKVFDHPVRGKEAAKRLFSLRQGSRSVAEMAVEFRTLAAVSGWNDEALQGVFINALSETLKDELVSHDESPTLDNLISLTIRLDNRIRERRRERSVSSKQPACRQPTPPRPFPTEKAESSRVHTRSAEPEAMEVGRARLSSEERARRIQARVCLYCGEAGHFVPSCPVRPGKGPAHH